MANSNRDRDSSMGANSDDTTQSLERMYTFNLSRTTRKLSTNSKNKGEKKVLGKPEMPPNEGIIDIQ